MRPIQRITYVTWTYSCIHADQQKVTRGEWKSAQHELGIFGWHNITNCLSIIINETYILASFSSRVIWKCNHSHEYKTMLPLQMQGRILNFWRPVLILWTVTTSGNYTNFIHHMGIQDGCGSSHAPAMWSIILVGSKVAPRSCDYNPSWTNKTWIHICSHQTFGQWIGCSIMWSHKCKTSRSSNESTQYIS